MNNLDTAGLLAATLTETKMKSTLNAIANGENDLSIITATTTSLKAIVFAVSVTINAKINLWKRRCTKNDKTGRNDES